jgi:hypothetical protein
LVTTVIFFPLSGQVSEIPSPFPLMANPDAGYAESAGAQTPNDWRNRVPASLQSV